MKRVTAVTALLISFLPLISLADEAVSVDYKYGHQLDVREVISVNTVKSDDSCGIQEKELIYKDSQGKEQKVVYEAISSGCNNS